MAEVQGAGSRLLTYQGYREPPSHKKYKLTPSTLKRLSLTAHDIDQNGYLFIPETLKIDNKLTREQELKAYMGHLYANNKTLKKYLSNNGKEYLNFRLNKFGAYNPAILVIQPLSYLDRVDLLKGPLISELVKCSPRFTLSLLTAYNCGLDSKNDMVRRGALSLVGVIGKHLGFKISRHKQTDSELTEDLQTLMAMRYILETAKHKESDESLRQNIIAVDNELESIEKEALEHSIHLKKQTIKKISA